MPRANPIDPASLKGHYRDFLGDDSRVLLTGHSHQAWPDVARAGVVEAYADAARWVDDKWERAIEAANAVRGAVAHRVECRAEDVAVAANTHELVLRLLSSIDYRRRRHIVTTSGEFHSLRRQLARLSEEGMEVSLVATEPLETLAARLAAAVREDTAALMASTVLFETAAIVPDLPVAVEAAHRVGAVVLLDAYHAFNVVPFRIADLGPDPMYVVAGGYKYAQWGEGCCFMRTPPDCQLRPVLTGWLSDFARLERISAAIGYGATNADRFAGATYDPTSHYRARAVIQFFDQHDLSVERLRELSLSQTDRILQRLADHDIRTPLEPSRRGGFVTVQVDDAPGRVRALRAQGIWVDARGDRLRIGPAPYLEEDELDRALEIIDRVIR